MSERVLTDVPEQSTPASLTELRSEVRDELRRADTKATTLLSLVGVTLAGVIALSGRSLPPISMVLLWSAAVSIAASVLLLLSVVRPRLSARPVAGTWLYAAAVEPDVLLQGCADMTPAQLAADTVVIARIARGKYCGITRAVWTLVAGLTLLALALFAAEVGGGQ